MLFLANRAGIRNKRLHRRITNRFRSDGDFETVELRIADHREPGPYRVVTETDPRVFLGDERYPVENARIEVGFDVGPTPDHYWLNWVEPDRNLLLGWHQDDDHPEHGPVHLQVNHGDSPVEYVPAESIDEHPMAVLAARLDQLPAAVRSIRWDGETVVGLDTSL